MTQLKNQKLESGVMTERMKLKGKELTEFQEFLLSKAQSRTKEEQRNLDLLAMKYQMEDYLKNDNPTEAIGVGEFLKSLIKTADVRQNKFAEYIGMKPSNLNKLLNGERRISSELAIILSNIFGVDALILISIQAKNELMELNKTRNQLLSKYTLKELIES